MNLELSDAEAEALAQELGGTINYARYPLSPRIQTMRAILQKIRPDIERSENTNFTPQDLVTNPSLPV
jgi:hypothetical protein